MTPVVPDPTDSSSAAGATAAAAEPAAWLQPRVIRLDERVAVVTGAAQGIGRATALALATFGADLVLVDKLDEAVAETGDLVRGLGRRATVVVGDVRSADVVDALAAAATSEHGRVDILVNNAGGGFWSPFDQISAKGEAALIAENFTQVTSCIRSLIPLMVDGGSIVNVTSIEGHRAGPGFSIYSAMKSAVENLSKTLALELAPRNIRVNCVAPDMIPTPGDAGLIADSGAMFDDRYAPTPLPMVATPEDAAAAILFLAGDLSRFVTGSTVHLDGGTFAASGWRRRNEDGNWVL